MHLEDFATPLLQYAERQLQTFHTGCEIRKLIAQLKTHSQPLVVFVDAINEVDDTAHALQGWINECAADAREQALKVVLSSRDDSLSVLESKDDIMLFTLTEFSTVEARDAAVAYQVQSSLDLDRDRHPLIFKIAAKLPGRANALALGRYEAIAEFVKHLIARAPDVKSNKVHDLYRACERVADKLDPDGDAIAWEDAANLVGGVAILDQLIAGGVLKAREGRIVRFAYDEMAEALRSPLKGDETTLVKGWLDSVRDVGLRRRLLGSLFKSVQTSTDVASDVFVHSLLRAMTQASVVPPALGVRVRPQDFAPIVGTVLRGLPRRLEELTGIVGRGFEKAVADWLKELSAPSDFIERELAGLDVPWQLKVAVLIEALASRSDEGLRDKDIFDRGGDRVIIRDAEKPKTIPGALLALIREHPAGMRERLLPHLNDSRALQGREEATLGGVVRALLVLSAEVEFEALAVLLLGRPDERLGLLLLEKISSTHPRLALDFAQKHFTNASAMLIMEVVLAPALQSMGPGHAPQELIGSLLKVMNEAIPATRQRAAELIRISDPDNLSAWDVLNDLARDGHATQRLRPIPRCRAEQYLDTLRRRHDEWSLTEIGYCRDGYLQPQLAAIAIELLPQVTIQDYYHVGGLAEDRAYRMNSEPGFECWRDFVLSVSKHPAEEVRRQLRYVALSSGDWSLELLTNILGRDASDELTSSCCELVLSRGGNQTTDRIRSVFGALLGSNFRATIRAAAGKAYLSSLRISEDAQSAEDRRLLFLFAEYVRNHYHDATPKLREWSDPDDAVHALAGLYQKV
jgi:hypothetical protein